MQQSKPKSARQRQSSPAARLENVELRNYHVQQRIDQDELALIYTATHTTLERPVQVAILRRSGWVASARFQLAARLAARLTHPHLLPVIDAGHDEKYGDYMVLPAIEAQRLSVLLQAGALEPVRALRIFTQIAAALDYLHANGVIHRDVQPSNILIAGDDLAYLTNLGLAASAETPADLGSLDEGDYLSPYSAPEQRLDQTDAAPALDIYSLGAVLYHMLWGDMPEGDGSPLPSLVDKLHAPEMASVDALLQRMLAPNPAARPASAGECATLLRRAMRQQLDRATPDMEESRWEVTAEWIENPLEPVLTSELRAAAAHALPEELEQVEQIVAQFQMYLQRSRERADSLHRTDAIRRRLNRWSRQGFFRRTGVGQLIEFEQVLSFNVYFYELRALYETRTHPVVSQRPMQPQDRRSTGELPQVWDVDVPDTPPYADVSPTQLILPNSTMVITCPECEGNAELICPRCEGAGMLPRERKVRHPDGSVDTEVISEQCPTCRTYGRVRCERCAGNGNLVEEATFIWSRRAMEFLNHDDDAEDDLLQPLVLQEHLTDVCSTPINVYGGHWHSVPPLDAMLRQAVSEIKDEQTRLIAAELTIKATPVTEVNYKLNDKDDTLYLIGMEHAVLGSWSLLNPERIALVVVGVLLVLGLLIWVAVSVLL